MTVSGDDLDRLIREALEEAEEEWADEGEGQSTAALLTGVFRGRNRLLAAGGAVANLAVFALGIYCGIRFVQADEPRSLAVWGAATLLCFAVVTAIKVWYWLEMNRLALTREIKRVELRLIQLHRHLERGAGEGG